ncbi:MAG: metal-activated pyridoxal enzyme [Actinobacteria bacterium]|nr:metal-activated pyridoxal enzyme [Actinomycetota bacterium]
MSRIHPGAQLRPHMKATKCTSLAKLQVESGHLSFTCATPREMIGMAHAGLGTDLLLANETLDAARLSAMAKLQDSSMITVAIDSDATLDAAAKAGIRNVLIDVNVGLPRCGVLPNLAGALADTARKRGLNVRGVMGYEGHLMMVADKNDRLAKVAESMLLLQHAAKDVGGEIISAGGTGTYDLHENTGVTEIQAGSYSLMDTQYSQLNLPFEQAVWVVGTVISSGSSWSVADVGLKSLGMDHGNPSIENQSVWFCSDEHITFATSTGDSPKVGSRIRVTPAHIDPTLAMHDIAWIVRGDAVIDQWAIDLRGW